MDLDRSVLAFLIGLGLDRAGIGQFGMKLEIDLLARHLGRQRALGRVGDLILRVMPRPLRHQSGKAGLQLG